MDPTGILDAVLAVAVFPGGAFLAIAALVHRALGGRPLAGQKGLPPPVTLVPLVAATIGTAMLPLIGTPALRLPPPSGPAGNLVAIAVLLAVAVDLGSRSRLAPALAGVAAVPLLALAAVDGSVNVSVLISAGGATALAARATAAALLVGAAAASAGGRVSSAAAASLALAAAALVVPTALPGASPVVASLAALGFVAVSGLWARLGRGTPRAALAAAGLTGAAGTALALISAHA